ncbi:I13R1 protein, partial [Tichodroma muraria]|nr:I13R1 protein [Tichodroma muraria]
VKPATPRQLTLSKTNDRIDVKWSESETFPRSCLHYEVKCCNGDLDIGRIIPVIVHQNSCKSYESFLSCSEMNSVSIAGIDANSKYTFKVRAKPKRECYNSDFHSDWSEEKSIGESTCPCIVALYSSSILILPPIPDPREILKRMFGEQNEDSQVSKKL